MNIKQISNNQLIRLSIIFVSLVIIAIIPPEILFDETQVVCIHYYLFGIQCPLCGMTRAVYQFTHFQFASAFNYNIIVALLPLYLGIDISTLFFRQKWLVLIRKTVVALILAGLIILYAFRIAYHFNHI
jgi:hypothetical protein